MPTFRTRLAIPRKPRHKIPRRDDSSLVIVQARLYVLQGLISARSENTVPFGAVSASADFVLRILLGIPSATGSQILHLIVQEVDDALCAALLKLPFLEIP
jgi:hypothetical protein